ncbi:sialate O-acetylesterase [Klebsiella pneumoniae]|uniref:sialate O-acetylesterase n=2 Tax=Klebsiella pneumoniae TaxID=573 RepID=UPI001E2E1EE7|nr:sialate O-acetylesterase [Klebsiella pneumoniae]MCD5866070.1 sialate O-acetylesterase [Klebsiella pneumoniae]MCO0287338.1 sialate O-acetylesterase [Klebsiella pneumoniae]MDZ6270840.1 sialate O-acetylesterase [Klebsiella pneumoniae]MDZ6328404.1 sialate O-acetylesterase [Klebsiella pneumoniae]WMW87526.1 sialate O-acetylesterase [Klebsiella pneumoniae]
MALTLLATNNAESTLASAISATDTSLIVSAGTGAEFPDAVAGESYFKLTLTDAATGSQVEIVNVTAKAGDIFTIERAQEGTLARAWAANDMVANMMTADTLNVIADFAKQASDSAEEAQGYALSASEFGDNKSTFADTAAGLAATTSGKYFRVPQGTGNVLAFRYYKNNSGVAQEVAEYPGQGSITNTIRGFPTLEAAQADADAGNILSGATAFYRSPDDSALAIEVMNVSGTLQPTGRKMPSLESLSSLADITTEDIAFLFSDIDGFHIADISLDSPGDPVFNLGDMSISRSADSVLIVADEDGFGVSLDESLERIAELEASKSDSSDDREIIRRLDTIATSASAAMLYPVSHKIARLRKGVNIFIGYGQSLAIGDEAYSVVTRAPSALGNKMLGRAVRGAYYDKTTDAVFGPIGGENKYYALEEKRQNGGSIITDPLVSTRLGETIMSGFLETLKTMHNSSLNTLNDDSVVLAGSVTGCVGTDIATLLKGAGTGYYERLISCINGHIEAAGADGVEFFQVAGILFLQGENDYDNGTSRESYRAMVNQLFDDISSDVKALTQQADNPAFFIYQTGGVYVKPTQNNSLPVDMAQLDITSRGDTFLVAPMFPYPQVSSWGAHKAANSYRWWGCAAANSAWNIYNRMNQSPFSMIRAIHRADSIFVAFNTPCPPLTSRPFYFVAQPMQYDDMGFSVIDSIGTLTGNDLEVDVVSPYVIRIKVSRKLSGDIRVNIGDNTHKGGHNISDSSPQQSIFSWTYYGDDNQSANENIAELNSKPYSLFNFAAIQTIDVEKG